MLSRSAFLSAWLLILPLFTAVAQRYTIQNDTKVAGRRIIAFQPIVDRKPTTNSGNLLSISPRQVGRQRAPIEFRPFEMVNPRTGKSISPNAQLSLKLKDGQVIRTVSAQQFFNELNKLEEELAKTGRSLRQPDALKDLRAEPVYTIAANQKPVMAPGFETISFQPLTTSSGRPTRIAPIDPDNISLSVSGNTLQKIASLSWSAKLYIAASTSDLGTVEFPVQWVTESIGSPGRKVFPLLIQINKGFEGLVKRIDWQVSDKPFDYTLKASPKLVASGSEPNVSWYENLQGISGYAPFFDYQKYRFTVVKASMEHIPEPVNTVKHYYARVLLYNQANEIIYTTQPVLLSYGYKPAKLEIPCTVTNTVPSFNYSFPSDTRIPFGIFVRGSGINTSSTTLNVMNAEKPEDNGLKYIGYRVSFNGEFGLRYFNFLHIVNPAEPVSNDLTLIRGDFVAVAGSPNTQEPQGARLDVSFLNGLYKESIPLVATLPNGGISLNYKVSQPLDMDLIHTRFFIGPIPVLIRAGISGEAGLNLLGEANLVNVQVVGNIRPFLNSQFYATGGVDAIIAYATMNANIDPLVYIALPVAFDSRAEDPLVISGEAKALYGKVYLKVGFFYPCPDLEKIVGWLAGDEEVPLCECAWEYNIFDFSGINHTWKY
ncbi:MAG: hypothetical protein RMJ87_08370 [Cytophagales bacterium]|nr:hypothetical protein [Cytophagales bacterium]